MIPTVDRLLPQTTVDRIHPGEHQQVPHRDEEMWPCVKPRAESLVNVMGALPDFTAENGATLIWPRSHSHDVNPTKAIAAQMQRGSALVYLASVTHCGGANRTNAPRTGQDPAVLFETSSQQRLEVDWSSDATAMESQSHYRNVA